MNVKQKLFEATENWGWLVTAVQLSLFLSKKDHIDFLLNHFFILAGLFSYPASVILYSTGYNWPCRIGGRFPVQVG